MTQPSPARKRSERNPKRAVLPVRPCGSRLQPRHKTPLSRTSFRRIFRRAFVPSLPLYHRAASISLSIGNRSIVAKRLMTFSKIALAVVLSLAFSTVTFSSAIQDKKDDPPAILFAGSAEPTASPTWSLQRQDCTSEPFTPIGDTRSRFCDVREPCS